MSVMKTSAPRARSRRLGSLTRIFAVVSVFAIILLGGAMIGTGVFSSRISADDPELYTGVIRLAPDRRTPCRQFEFDNRSATMRSVRPDQCNDDLGSSTRSESAKVGGSIGRMNSIGNHFKAQ